MFRFFETCFFCANGTKYLESWNLPPKKDKNKLCRHTTNPPPPHVDKHEQFSNPPSPLNLLHSLWMTPCEKSRTKLSEVLLQLFGLLPIHLLRSKKKKKKGEGKEAFKWKMKESLPPDFSKVQFLHNEARNCYDCAKQLAKSII